MRPGAARITPKVTTRDRILDAAIMRFSRNSYEETGLRDIAADVGIDVAYVHRCFGSKHQLFAEAIRVTLEPERIFGRKPKDLAATLAGQVFARDPVSSADVGPLDIVNRSLTSPEAAEILREFVLQDVIKPLAGELRAPAHRRATLIAAFLAGLCIFRNVLCIDDLREAGGKGFENAIADVIRMMMDTSPGGAAPSIR